MRDGEWSIWREQRGMRVVIMLFWRRRRRRRQQRLWCVAITLDFVISRYLFFEIFTENREGVS